MELHVWLMFVMASLVLTMTPGPSILLGIVHSLNYGPRKTVYTVLGDISANLIQMIIVSVGLGIVIATSEVAFQAVKWFGVVTLFYMGIKMLLSKSNKIEKSENVSAVTRKKMFLSGFLVAAGNPKAIVFFTAFFPQFIDPDKSLLIQMLIMCPTMMFLDFMWVMIYSISATKFLDRFQTSSMYINKFGGSCLLGASGFLALSSKSNT